MKTLSNTEAKLKKCVAYKRIVYFSFIAKKHPLGMATINNKNNDFITHLEQYY